VIGARLLADREVIPQAMKLNPAFFKIVYTDLLNTKKTLKNVQGAWVKDHKVECSDGKITGYKVILKVTFVLQD